MTIAGANAKTIAEELNWFQRFINLRLKVSFEKRFSDDEFQKLKLPSIKNQDSPYANLIEKYQMGMEERLVLILALIPFVKPSLLDFLHLKNTLYNTPFTEFGGVMKENHKGFLPTGETAMFLLVGENLEKRFNLTPLFKKDHFFYKDGILILDEVEGNKPFLQGQLSILPEYLSLVTTGNLHNANFNPHFQAKRINTSQDWSDLILSDHLLSGVEEIKSYVKHGKSLKNNFLFGKKIKPGFTALFTGPSGTGKTMTASLLGKEFQLDVYKIDLSRMLSKYIGETEKNLSQVFEMAASKDWILFFDEADAIFGKRTNVRDAHDKYANQEVSYLLQRIEDFDGLVIVSSNMKKNFEERFFKKFQIVLDFEIPTANQRSILWKNSITKEFEYDTDVDIDYLSKRHQLTGASIVNILQSSILKCLGRNERIIKLNDIDRAIRKETIRVKL